MTKERKVKMGFLKKYILKYWKLFCFALLFLSLEATCDLLQPTIMSKIVDIGVKEKRIDFVIHMGMLMLGITAVGALAAVCRNNLASNVSQSFGADLRLDLFKKIQHFSFDNINKFEGASLITRLTNDVTQVQNFSNGMMRIFVKAPIVGIGSLIMALRLNARLAMILLAIVPIVFLLIYLNIRISYPLFRKVQNSLDDVNSVMREYLSGVRVVKAFNRFNYEEERFAKANDELVSHSVWAMRAMSVFSPSVTLIVNIGIVLILWIGGGKVSQGSIQVGQIIAFTNYMTQILFSLMVISNVFNMFVRARASAERIGEVFEEEESMKNGTENAIASGQQGKIQFENVSFSYKGSAGKPALKNVSFTGNKGEIIGIIGSTGSGKSSLVNLIPRFYDAASGEIKVNGVSIKEWDVKKLREIIAVVPQKTTLFTGSILENIRWGKDDANLKEVKTAASIAQANDFINAFTDGYDTTLGQGGVNLSGGQRQRIAIARALVRKPEILILDDSTSAVDAVTETNIREGLKEYLGDVTCILIAQRITSVMDTDKILVLDDGEIIGMGKHQELMENCGVYQDIFRSQLGKEKMQ